MVNPTPNESAFVAEWGETEVGWLPWGPDAFERARTLNRPILLSIGYPASRWCKQMADEVYSAAPVADAIAAGFVPVVVDRDTRPDIDAVYMAALMAIAGRGGWPLTAVVDHLGQPFWIGTYVAAEPMVELLTTLSSTWTEEPDKIEATTAQVTERVSAATAITPANAVPGLEAVNLGLTQLANTFDTEWGGFGREPKFASPPHLHLMLRAALATAGEGPKTVVSTTLDAMSAGGVCDQIGGGFHRYATDREWLIPRFEKMLYDQAQLITCYQDAFSMWGSALYQRVVVETIDYCLDRLRIEGGGFVTAEAGESIGPSGTESEGVFYTWTPEEITAVLANARVGDDPVDVGSVLEWYDITEEGHLDGRSIPNRRHHRDDQLRSPEMSSIRLGLRELRKRRPQPALDATVITEHHALAVRALAGAAWFYRVPAWRDAAVEAGEFLLDHLRGPNGWYRSWRSSPGGDVVAGAALAGDYAAGINACLRLGDLTGQPRWIEAATEAADLLLDNFFDPVDGGLWSTSEYGEELFVRLKQIEDRSVPSPNALAAEGLLRLAAVGGEMRYKHQAERILQLIGGVAPEQSITIPYGLSVAESYHRGFVQIVVADGNSGDRPDWLGDDGGEAARMIRLLGSLWRPNHVVWWGDELDSPLTVGRAGDGGPTAYVCREFETVSTATTAEELYGILTGRPLAEGQQLNA